MRDFKPKYKIADRSLTWYEGYNSARNGWFLHKNASPAYRDGFLYYRNLFVGEE